MRILLASCDVGNQVVRKFANQYLAKAFSDLMPEPFDDLETAI